MGDFEGRVAIVTGAAAGLGRAHAIALAREGACVVVNDIAAAEETGQAVVAEIEATGGVASFEQADVSNLDDVTAMVNRVIEGHGKVDTLICNAGILRDKSFVKMEMADFSRVLAVHLEGSANCCHAVWGQMRAQGYGRILLTTSSSGLYGNFGQSNYGAAKAGMVGLMNCLYIEGSKYDIRVNCLSPTAATGMTEALLEPGDAALLSTDCVSPAALYLTGPDAPSRMIMGAGAGVFSAVRIVETEGVWLAPEDRTPKGIAERIDQIGNFTDCPDLPNAFAQTNKFIKMARGASRG